MAEILGAYPITEQLISNLASVNQVSVDVHDSTDPESSDIIWIIKYPEGSMCDGEYLSLSPSSPNSVEWHVSHKAADVSGGHPTLWSKGGCLETLLPEIEKYFLSRKTELKN